MIHTETKFAYRHKPTGKWVYIYSDFDNELWDDDKSPYVYKIELVEHFTDASIEPENLLRSNLKASSQVLLERLTMNDEKYASQNFEEFELVEIEIEYRLKT